MKGLEHILVPLDGSRFAEAALPTARALQQASQARLTVAMAHESRMALVAAGEVPIGSDFASFEVERRQREQEYLATISTETGGVEHAFLEGKAGPSLVEYLANTPTDLVVMSTHGRGPLTRFWLGSVTDYVIRHTPTPLLLLHPKDTKTAEPQALPLRRGLVLLDQSTDAEAILEVLGRFALLTQSHLTLFHAVPLIPAVPASGMPAFVQLASTETLEAQREEAQRYLDRTAATLRSRGMRVASVSDISVDVAAAVLERLDGNAFDFVALTTHGLGGWKRFMLGSVADKVIRASSKPVLVVRPAET